MSISLSLSMAEEVDSDVRSVSFLCAEKIAANGPRPKAWIVSAQTTEEAAGANISGIIALLFDDLSPFFSSPRPCVIDTGTDIIDRLSTRDSWSKRQE